MAAERTITTPADLSPAVLAYGASLGAGVPEFVPVRPAVGAIEDQCFFNVIVSGAAEDAAAKPVFGWLIWELTGFWLEAQRHAVLERDGALVDITPPLDGEDRIVFLRDPDWTFDYQAPKPTRRPARHLLTEDRAVAAWAKLADEFDAFKWRHSKFDGQKIVFSIPPGKDHRRMERLQRDYNAAAKIALAKPL